MRNYRSVIAVLSGLGLSAFSTAAFAGGCFGPSSANCAPSVVVTNSTPRFDPVNVHINQPMGHLRSVHYSRSPHVSITRVHSLAQVPTISDVPSGFAGGCHPTTTRYCSGGTAAPAPRVSPPTPMPSSHQPRQYGDATFVPGIAHVPTSYVDRSVQNNQAVLNSGRTVTQSTTLGGIAPGMLLAQRSPVMQNPAPVSMAGNGTYWETTSGPTMIGGMMASKVMCKRAAPTQVVRPVIGVPVPVPVSCSPMQPHAPHMGHPMMGQPMMGPMMAGGPSPQGRWTY